MRFGNMLLLCAICSGTVLGVGAEIARADDCKEPATGTKDVPVLSPPPAAVVTGAGRLQFYLAPNLRCAMDGVFVIPKNHLTAYAETSDGWPSVMYMSP